MPQFVPSRVLSALSDSVEWVPDLLLTNGMGWNCGLINSLFEADKAACIKGIPLLTVPQEDCLLWGERLGIYTVRSGYRLLLQSSTHTRIEHAIFKQVWNVNCLPKIKIIVWKFVCGFVATRECLYSRRIAHSPLCPNSNTKRESVNHVLHLCVFVHVMFG